MAYERLAYSRHEITPDNLARMELDHPDMAANIRAICRPDRTEQKIRFGPSTWSTVGGQADYIAAAEFIINEGHTSLVWDFIADKRLWPPDMSEASIRYIARKAAARDKELGRNSPAADALAATYCAGPERLKIENEKPEAHRAARDAIRKNPQITIGQICRYYGFSRADAQQLKQDALGVRQIKNRRTKS
jgi:hypothetical protein